MSETPSNVQEVFGQYAVEINGNVELFDTREAAQTAYDADANAAHFLKTATAYTNARGLTAKNAKGKINVIVDFLAFNESYDPDAEVAEVAEEETAAAGTDEVTF